MKSYILQNGTTKVPHDTQVYHNKAKFDKSLLTIVDTSVVYEEFDQRYNILRRLDNHVETSIYGVYHFYPDGRFNKFFLDRDKLLEVNDFNPDFGGNRGVYYTERNQIRYDIFAESNELGWLGELNGTFKFSGDTLYVIRDIDKKYVGVYIKRKLPANYLNYRPEW